MGEKKPTNGKLEKLFITQAKKTDERQWLSEILNIPLQQSLNDLNQAPPNFFKSSCLGERKGKAIKPPKFKKGKSKQAGRFRKDGFKIYQNKVYATKIGEIKIVWSRELPSQPTSATVIQDSNRSFISFVVEIQPEKLAKTQSVGIDLGRKTFATSRLGK